MLMPSEVGFWRDVVKYMPDSQLIEQNTRRRNQYDCRKLFFASFNTDVGIRITF